jgi:hypothetical protein
MLVRWKPVLPQIKRFSLENVFIFFNLKNAAKFLENSGPVFLGGKK